MLSVFIIYPLPYAKLPSFKKTQKNPQRTHKPPVISMYRESVLILFAVLGLYEELFSFLFCKTFFPLLWEI